MRSALAAVFDTVLVAACAYLAFLLGVWATPCGGHPGNCAVLTPLVLILVVLAVALYFGVAHLCWRATIGQKIFGSAGGQKTDDTLP